MKKIIHLIWGLSAIIFLPVTAQAQYRSGNSRQTSNQVNTEKKTYTEAEIAKLMDIKSYPDYDLDKAEIDRIYALYNSTSRTGKVERLEKLKSSKQKVEEIGKKYSEYWSVYWDQMKKMEPMDAKWEKLKSPVRSYGPKTSFIDIVQEEADKKLKQQGNPTFVVPKMLSDAEAKAKGNSTLFDKPDFKSANYDNKQKMANSKWASVNLDLEDINYIIALAKYKSGEESSDVKELMKKRDESVANIDGYKKDFNSKVVSLCMAELATIKPPMEIYTGGDKEQLRKAIQAEWKNGYCKENTLVKIIFNGSKWTKDNRRIYENASSDGSVVTARDQSNSYLDVTIIYKDPKDSPEMLNEWDGYVDKDNTEGKNYFHICPEGGFGPKKILAKNVK